MLSLLIPAVAYVPSARPALLHHAALHHRHPAVTADASSLVDASATFASSLLLADDSEFR